MPEPTPGPGGRPAPAGRAVAVRYRPGVIGESQRQTHMALTGGGTASYWTAVCGQIIPDEVAEVTEHPAGMPCLRCLVGLPTPPGC